jgi:hypothetical protein
MARKRATSTLAKTRAERAVAPEIPLSIRDRLGLGDANRDEVRERLERKLAKLQGHIERVSVRFEDVNGPRGGVDALCRIKVVLPSLPSVVVDERAADPLVAFTQAADAASRAVARVLRRADGSGARGAGKRAGGRAQARSASGGKALRDDDGSLIGRRVGRGPANLEDALDRPEKRRRDVFVDTAAPGVSATERRAGYGATAARNTKRNVAGMTAALEDSRTTPSRKSTRKSKNRAKAATPLQRTVQLQAHSPGARANRAKARRGK